MDRRVGLKAPTSTYVAAGNGVSSIGNNDDHIAIAEEAARKSMVLLKNCPMTDKACAAPATDDSNVLPIKPTAGAVTKIAVVGRRSATAVTPRVPGSSCATRTTPTGHDQLRDGHQDRRHGIEPGQRRPREVREPVRRHLRGGGRNRRQKSQPDRLHRRQRVPVTTATTSGGDVTPAVAAAQAADAVVVVVGLTPYNEGEQYNGNDRENLSLDGKDHGRGYGS